MSAKTPSGDAMQQHWVRLRTKDPSQSALTPEETEVVTHELVRRVQARAGKPAQSVKVLRNLGAFLVSAEPDFMKELGTQPEVESVKSASEPDLGLIRPLKSKDIDVTKSTARTRPKRQR